VNELKDHLVKARSYIEKGWTQGEYARDKEGDSVTSWDPTAVCWCARGAFRAVDGNYPSSSASDHSVFLLAEIGHFDSPTLWNDYSKRTQQDVLALFDKAIAVA